MVSVCVPTTEDELEEKVSKLEPELVETVTQSGITSLSNNVTVVKPQIEDMVDVLYNLLSESFKKGYVTVIEFPSIYTKELVQVTVFISSKLVTEQLMTKFTTIVEV